MCVCIQKLILLILKSHIKITKLEIEGACIGGNMLICSNLMGYGYLKLLSRKKISGITNL